MVGASVKGPGSQQGNGKSFLLSKDSDLSADGWGLCQRGQAPSKEMVNQPCSQRTQNFKQVAEVSAKGPSSQQGDGKSVLLSKN